MELPKKLASFIVLVFSMILVAGATDIIENTSEIYSISTNNFSVTVPMTLPIYIDSDGNVTTSNDAYVINNSDYPIKIVSIEIHEENGWGLVDYTEDLTKLVPGGKGFKFEIGDKPVGMDGLLDISGIDSILTGDTYSIDYNVDIQPQVDIVDESIAQVIFTVDWESEQIKFQEEAPIVSSQLEDITDSILDEVISDESNSGLIINIPDETISDNPEADTNDEKYEEADNTDNSDTNKSDTDNSDLNNSDIDNSDIDLVEQGNNTSDNSNTSDVNDNSNKDSYNPDNEVTSLT